MLRANMRMRAAGSEKSFAAGADIKEMAGKDFMECMKSNFVSNWGSIGNARKPVIAVRLPLFSRTVLPHAMQMTV
eukprot:1465138-Rhodomonas_salina.1